MLVSNLYYWYTLAEADVTAVDLTGVTATIVLDTLVPSSEVLLSGESVATDLGVFETEGGTTQVTLTGVAVATTLGILEPVIESGTTQVTLTGVSISVQQGVLTVDAPEEIVEEGAGWTSSRKKKRLPPLPQEEVTVVELVGIGVRTRLGNLTSELSVNVRSAGVRSRIGRLSAEIHAGLHGVGMRVHLSHLSPEFYKTYTVEEMNELILQLEEMDVL